MKKVESVFHIDGRVSRRWADCLTHDGQLIRQVSWPGYEVDARVGIEGEWVTGKREIKRWDVRVLPEGGKRGTWKQVLCHTE